MSAETTDKSRSKAVENAISQIEKQYGKGSIMKMGQAPRERVPVISTGAVSLDHALGVGGLPRGRVVEVYGPEGSGKTTIALHVVAECQKSGGTAAFIDAEHALDVDYCENLGINIDELLLSQPDTGEQALDICELLIRSGAVDLVVIDSVAVLVPRAEIEGEMGDSHVGLQARLMSQALRKLTGILAKSHTTAIFINQIREKIGVMFGSPETTPGGRALKFYSSVRLDIRRIANIKDKDETIGARTRVKVVKNKVSPPFKQAEFDIIFGRGISSEGDLLDLGVENDLVDKMGTWFTYGDERLGQGRENSKNYLRDNPETFKRLNQQVREKLGMLDGQAPKAEAEAKADEGAAGDAGDADGESDTAEKSAGKSKKTSSKKAKK